MATLTVENLSKRYGEIQALKDVSFEVQDGEFVIVLGVSGAGKSTLLRCLNGLTRPTSGAVLLDDEPIRDADERIGMIFQQHNIIGPMSAYGNALMGSLGRTSYLRSLFQWNSRTDKLRALRALETVGLGAESGQSTVSMSGGQQQRVGIARALVQQPELLLADEPVASLDPASAETVMGYLRAAAEQEHLTTVASLHQVNIARQFGERFLGLRNGELIFDGALEHLTVDVIDEIYGEVTTEGFASSESELTPGRDEDPAVVDGGTSTRDDRSATGQGAGE